MPVEIGKGSDALGNLQLAYVTSIHKVQGSEFPCAVVVAHKSHSFMLRVLSVSLRRGSAGADFSGGMGSLQKAAHRGAADLQAAGDLGLADAGLM